MLLLAKPSLQYRGIFAIPVFGPSLVLAFRTHLSVCHCYVRTLVHRAAAAAVRYRTSFVTGFRHIYETLRNCTYLGFFHTVTEKLLAAVSESRCGSFWRYCFIAWVRLIFLSWLNNGMHNQHVGASSSWQIQGDWATTSRWRRENTERSQTAPPRLVAIACIQLSILLCASIKNSDPRCPCPMKFVRHIADAVLQFLCLHFVDSD